MTPISGSYPRTSYVEAPQGHVAYQSFGQPSDHSDGDILFITNALLNIDAVWDEPSAARFLDRLGTMGRVVMFNMLGSGVSDPIADRSMWPPIETIYLEDDTQCVVMGGETGDYNVPGDPNPERRACITATDAVRTKCPDVSRLGSRHEGNLRDLFVLRTFPVLQQHVELTRREAGEGQIQIHIERGQLSNLQLEKIEIPSGIERDLVVGEAQGPLGRFREA